MQIAKSTDILEASSVRLADIGDYIIINGVPYDKKTNAPVPFNITNLPRENFFACGYGINTKYTKARCGESKSTSGSIGTMYQDIPININFKNTLIDNVDTNIIWVVPSTYFQDNSVYSNATDINNNRQIVLYKLYKTEKGIDTTPIKISDAPYYAASSTSSNQYRIGYNCFYMTQNVDNIFIIVSAFIPTNAQGNATNNTCLCAIKVNKKTLEYTQTNLCPYYHSTPAYAEAQKNNYYKNNSGYNVYNTFNILYENKEGIVFTNTHREYYSNGSSSGMYHQNNLIFYSFDSSLCTPLFVEGEVLPWGINTNLASNVHAGTTGNPLFTRISIPSETIEYNNEIYTYLFENEAVPTVQSAPITSLFKIILDESELKLKYNKIELIFPEDSEITNIPYHSTYQVNSNSTYITYQNSFVYKAFAANYNGKEYIHLFYIGYYQAPITARGIYTFELNEEKTQATLVSFYPAAGGALLGFLQLNEERDKIAFVTANSYHFLKFNTISKKWFSTFDNFVGVQSMIKTDENKIYVITEDNTILCNDLNGAVIIDFDFEKSSYNYNNAEIDSYISIWAKNSDEQFTETDIKLTIIGDCVWKENGLQTLITKTSDVGPINIPFTIKGQTSISVGVDAII